MTDLISVSVNDGKYTIQQTAPGRWECLRHGEHWPAMASGPDNLHVALAYEVDELQQYKRWYNEAQEAANEAGFGPGSAADAIRHFAEEVRELRDALANAEGAA